jgi:hypothetical protein
MSYKIFERAQRGPLSEIKFVKIIGDKNVGEGASSLLIPWLDHQFSSGLK